LSGKSGNDGVFGEAAVGGDGSAAGAGEVVAIGAGNAFDDANVAQAGELSGEGGRGALGEQWSKVGAAEASDDTRHHVTKRCLGDFALYTVIATPVPKVDRKP
jgi:hypothetical protein